MTGYTKESLRELLTEGRRLVMIGEGQKRNEQEIIKIGNGNNNDTVVILGWYEGEEEIEIDGIEFFPQDSIYELVEGE